MNDGNHHWLIKGYMFISDMACPMTLVCPTANHVVALDMLRMLTKESKAQRFELTSLQRRLNDGVRPGRLKRQDEIGTPRPEPIVPSMTQRSKRIVSL